MRKNHIILAIAVIISAMLACNLPSNNPNQQNPDAILTAALTVQAEISTNTPAAPLATSAGSPTDTPTIPPSPLTIFTASPIATATTQCDIGSFINDVTVPDGTVYTPGFTFTKTWKIQNIGSCTWSGYSLVFDSGNSMGGLPISAIPTTAPGQYVNISVSLTAPATNGPYRGYWRIRNASGVLIPVLHGYNGQSFYVDIQVQSPAVFAITSVTYTLSTWSSGGNVNCPRVTAHITANGAGTVTYHWIRSDGGSTSTFTLTYGSAGTQSTNYDWALPHVWNGTTDWVGIYIDSPNHQSIGNKTFTTACTSP